MGRRPRHGIQSVLSSEGRECEYLGWDEDRACHVDSECAWGEFGKESDGGEFRSRGWGYRLIGVEERGEICDEFVGVEIE